MLDHFWNFDAVSVGETVLRIGMAAGFGLVLGLERDWRKRPIDFRAYMIVAVSTCLIAIMAQEVLADYQHTDQTLQLDFMRAVEGVLTGIGFLGAGAILRHKQDNRVIGTATGASIWAAGGLGLTLGFGLYGLALIGFAAIVATLFVLGLCMPIFTYADHSEDGSDETP
jgi:putative Mg2+ transporter-C (MgtC) family protein